MAKNNAAIRGAGALVTAVPAFFGFTPDECLVVVRLAKGALAAAVRIDFDAAIRAAEHDISSLVGHEDDRADMVALIGIGVNSRRDDALNAVAAACLADGMYVTATIKVDRIAFGERWIDHSSKTEGLIDDPTTCPAALDSLIERGRGVASDREELRIEVTATGANIVASKAPSNAGAARAVRAVLAAMDRHMNGHPLSDADVAKLAGGLLNKRVRDAVVAIGLTGRREAARAVFADVTRRVCGPARAEAATIVAVLAYFACDGALLRMALEEAQREAPKHSLALMVAYALDMQIHPTKFEEALAPSRQILAELGIVVPD